MRHLWRVNENKFAKLNLMLYVWQMTKYAIIEEIAKDSEYKKICRKICDNLYLSEELYSELMIVLLEYPDEKIILIHKEKRIKWFIISILLKMCHSKTSPFYKNIRKFSLNSKEIDASFDLQDESKTEEPVEFNELKDVVDLPDDVLLQTEDGYEKMLLKLSVEMKSVQKLSKEMDANYLSIWISINNYKKKLKQKYGKV